MNLWKYLLLLSQNSKEEEKGFTIPLILGIGLFMLLAGVAAIKTSSTSRTDSQIQETSAQALAAAESGVAKLQALLDAERSLAVYNDCVGTRDSNGTCPDSGTTPSWSNATNIQTSSTSIICGNTVNSSSRTAIEAIASSTAWQDISNNPADGQFRLLSYTYNASDNANEPPGIGELIIQGRTGQNTANATGEGGYNTGIVELRTEIPIKENPKTSEDTIPGLWTKYNASFNLGNHDVNGSILIEGCFFPPGYENQAARNANLVNPKYNSDGTERPGGTQTFTFAPSLMPDVPDLPDPEYLHGDGVSQQGTNGAADPPIENAYDHAQYPRTGDIPGPDGSYHYLIQEIATSGNSILTIEEGKKVIFYVQSDIDIRGTPYINNGANNLSTNLQIYGNVDMCDEPLGFNTAMGQNPYDTCPNGNTSPEKYKYGCPAGASCPTESISISGTGGIKAVVHAPDAIGCVAGGGSIDNFVGTLWINTWGGCSNSNGIKINSDGEMSEILAAVQNVTIEPQVSPMSNWVRREVSQ